MLSHQSTRLSEIKNNCVDHICFREPNTLELLPPEASRPLSPRTLRLSPLATDRSPSRARPGLLPPLQPSHYSPEDRRSTIPPVPTTTSDSKYAPQCDSIGDNGSGSTPSCGSNTLNAWLQPNAMRLDHPGLPQEAHASDKSDQMVGQTRQTSEGIKTNELCGIGLAVCGNKDDGRGATSEVEALAQVRAVIKDLARGRPMRPAAANAAAPGSGPPVLAEPRVAGDLGLTSPESASSNFNLFQGRSYYYDIKRRELDLLHSELDSKLKEMQRGTDGNTADGGQRGGGGRLVVIRADSSQDKNALAAISQVEEKIKHKLQELSALAPAPAPYGPAGNRPSSDGLTHQQEVGGSPQAGLPKPPGAHDDRSLMPQVLDVLSACKKRNAASGSGDRPGDRDEVPGDRDEAVDPAGHPKTRPLGGGEIQGSLSEIEKIIGSRIAHIEKLTKQS